MAHHGSKLLQLDVRAAFLNGPLQEELYIQQPEGFEKHGEEHLVLKLHKALYGLKQAARAWNDQLCEILANMGFKRSESDEPLFYRGSGSEQVFLLAYVDDILMGVPDINTLRKVAEKLAESVELRIENTVDRFWGLIFFKARGQY